MLRAFEKVIPELVKQGLVAPDADGKIRLTDAGDKRARELVTSDVRLARVFINTWFARGADESLLMYFDRLAIARDAFLRDTSDPDVRAALKLLDPAEIAEYITTMAAEEPTAAIEIAEWLLDLGRKP